MNQPTSISYTSSDFLKLLLDNTTEIFVVIDASLNLVLFNTRAAQATMQFLGKELKEGSPILDYARPEKVGPLKFLFAEVFSGTPKKYKYPFPNGKIYSMNFYPVFESGAVKFISLTCVDITTEEEALRQMLIQRQLLERAERIAGIGSWEWDIPTDKVVWSDELFRLMGLEPGETVPTKLLGFRYLHPDDVEMAELTLTHSFKTGEPYSRELRLITKDGSQKYVLCQGIIIRNELGRNEKFVGTLHDITSRKQLEKSVQNQEARFRFLIENSADLIVEISEQRIITYVSPAIISMMGYTTGEVIGKRLGLLAHPDDLPWLVEEFSNILTTPGESKSLQYRVIKKDGSYLWVDGTISNLLHIPGVSSIVLNQRNISQRKEAERLLNQLNETLRNNAAELTSSNVELERFAYVASHDLQEPLRMVTSFLQLLKKKYEDSLDAKAQQYIYYAVDGAERMKRLINDLLEYSRAGNKRGPVSKLDMNEIVASVSVIFEDQIQKSGGELITGKLPVIMAEKTQMIQLFQNLVANALKYRSAAAPRIHIAATENEHGWLFSIEDNGIGIAPKYSEEIFNIFQRLHGKNEYEGTGIGLAICKKIVEAHNGTIWVIPAAEQGSIFYFTIKKQLAPVA